MRWSRWGRWDTRCLGHCASASTKRLHLAPVAAAVVAVAAVAAAVPFRQW